MLEKVKTALRITASVYDGELNDLISAAEKDLEIAGIVLPSTPSSDALIVRAIITYCRANFSSPADYDRLKASYDEQKAQMISATGYGLAVST